MSRASYRNAIDWIAENDESAERDVNVMADVPTVALVAEIFQKPTVTVALAVVRQREKLWGKE